MAPPLIGLAAVTDVVIIRVGPEQRRYHLHKDLLTYHSEYFQKALNGPWVESQDGVITLEDIETPIFNLFAHWLYTEKVPGYTDDSDWNKITEVTGTTSRPDGRFYVYISAYVFGDRFLVPQFRQTIQEAYGAYIMHEHVWGPRSVEAVTVAFENLPACSSLLQQIVDDYCTSWTTLGQVDKEQGSRVRDANGKAVAFQTAMQKCMPIAFMVRTMRRFQELRSIDQAEPSDKSDGFCCYIEHSSTENKNKCMGLHMRIQMSPASCICVLQGLKRDYLPKGVPPKETTYPHIMTYAFTKLSTDNALILDLVEHYSFKYKGSPIEWEEELRDACFYSV